MYLLFTIIPYLLSNRCEHSEMHYTYPNLPEEDITSLLLIMEKEDGNDTRMCKGEIIME